MAQVKITDDSLWTSQIEGGASLYDRITSLSAGDVIELEVAGIVGRWEKMKDGRDGRSTSGIKPIGNMKKVWKRFQSRRGQVVEIREVQTADAFVDALSGTLAEWNSPQDEEAFRDL